MVPLPGILFQGSISGSGEFKKPRKAWGPFTYYHVWEIGAGTCFSTHISAHSGPRAGLVLPSFLLTPGGALSQSWAGSGWCWESRATNKFKQQTGGGDERDPVTLLPIQGREGEVQLKKSQETKTPAKVTLLREVTFLP